MRKMEGAALMVVTMEEEPRWWWRRWKSHDGGGDDGGISVKVVAKMVVETMVATMDKADGHDDQGRNCFRD